MNRILYVTTTLLCLGWTAAVSAQQRNSDVKFRLAQSYERSGDWENAVKFYEELYAKDSTNAVLYDALRRGYLQLKRYDDAVHLIQTQMRFRPNDIVLLSQLGIVYARAGEEERGVSAWDRAVAIDKRNPNVYRVIANAAIESRLFDRAIAFYLRGRSEIGDPMLFAAEIANLYSLMMNFTNATKEYLTLIKQSPAQLGFVQSRMATYTSRADGLNAATAVVESALRSEPNAIALHQLLAWLLMEGRHFEKAYDVYIQLDERVNAGGREIYSFAERALKEKAYAAAAKAFRTLIEKYPKFDQIVAKFGYARTLEESVAAEDTSTLLLVSNPIGFGHGTDPFGAPELQTSEAQSKYADVIAAYKDVVREYPKSDIAAQALERIATIKFERFFNVDGAITTLRQLIQEYGRLAPIVAGATLLLGDALLAKGDVEEAAKHYRSIADYGAARNETKEIAYLRTAEVEFFRGNFQEAAKLLQELTKNPKSDVTNDALTLLIFIQENSLQSSAALKDFAKAGLFIRQRKLPEATVTLESIQKQYPASPLIDETLMLAGDVLIAMKRYTDGISAYDRLIHQFPESIVLDKAQMKIGHVYQWKLNDKANAIAAYKSVLEKFPTSIYANEARKRIRALRGDSL